MNETAAIMIFMAMTSTVANHQMANLGPYVADDTLRFSANRESCETDKAVFDSANGICSVVIPGGRLISFATIGNKVAVRIETKYGEKVVADFTGVVVDQHRDELIVHEAILRDPEINSYGQDGILLPNIERAGRGACRLNLKLRADGTLDAIPGERCDHRLAITGAAKNS